MVKRLQGEVRVCVGVGRLVWRRVALAGCLAALMPIAGTGVAQAVGGAQSGSGSAQTAQQSGQTKQTIAEKIAASKELLDINTATPAQLKALPGMGDAYAARVIAGRPYTAKNQLTTRGILQQA
jgi:DNA uptake protein ComE-like DNA-binding protein